jgi:hypothetical protein
MAAVALARLRRLHSDPSAALVVRASTGGRRAWPVPRWASTGLPRSGPSGGELHVLVAVEGMAAGARGVLTVEGWPGPRASQ